MGPPFFFLVSTMAEAFIPTEAYFHSGVNSKWQLTEGIFSSIAWNKVLLISSFEDSEFKQQFSHD